LRCPNPASGSYYRGRPVRDKEAWLTVTDPRTERGVGDYRLDQREQQEQHPRTVSELMNSTKCSEMTR
jgi:hypothetical protein